MSTLPLTLLKFPVVKDIPPSKIPPSFTPSTALFILPSANLNIYSYNSLTGVKLGFRGTVLTSDGQYQNINFVSSANIDSTRAQYIEVFPMTSPGWLISALLYQAGGSSQVGQTWAFAELSYPGAGGVYTTISPPAGYSGVIPGGYITKVHSGYFPYLTTKRYSTEGPGTRRSLSITAPAAGADWTFTIPTGSRMRIKGVSFQIATSTVIANRNIALLVTDGTNNLRNIVAESAANTAGNVAASTTVRVWGVPAEGGQYQIAPAAVAEGVLVPIPTEELLPAGYVIGSSTVNLQPTDAYTSIFLDIEDYIDYT